MKKDYVLSIEDSQTDIALMRRVFDKEITHCDINHIEDGETAIAYFESSEFQENPPRCIFMDIKLPKMNGLEVLNYLRNKKNVKDVPVIMLSSSDRPEEIRMTYSLGGNSYIEKPKSYLELQEKIPIIVDYWLAHNKSPL